MLVVQDSWGYCFGAFIPTSLTTAHGSRYYGGGETWLYSFHNQAPEQVGVYRWTRANELFILSSERQLAIGGGGGFGLQLDDDLDNGVSNPCATFENLRLSSTEFFKTLNVELFMLKAVENQREAGGGSAIDAQQAFEFDNDC